MKKVAFFASCVVFSMLLLPCFSKGEGMQGTDAEALYERALALWEAQPKNDAEIADVIRICEQLLANRESLQASEQGKIILGKTYYLIGQAYNAQQNAASDARRGPRTGSVKTLVLTNDVTVEMIYCEPGEFVMGSPFDEEGRDSDEPQHKVTLTKGFWLSKCEITQAQWECIMNKNPSTFKNSGALPVDSVSWNDCKEFCYRLNKISDCGARLPTEAEWEYACRAGTKTAFFWGNSLNGRRANCNGDFPCATRERGPYLRHPTFAGHYAANPWGFFDMHGNMYEWCEDKCGDYPSGDLVDPVGSSHGKCRIMRGGCWYFGARFCRSANRIKNSPSYADAFTGFRLCCDKIP